MPSTKRSIQGISLLILFLMACAKQGFPPGGPVDKQPPRILSTLPKSDSIHVAQDSKVIIQFSEPVDHRTCEESIFITPLPAADVRYKWHGNKVEIRFAEPLLENRTYVITIGTGAKDRRNLAMASSHSFAFSTGDSLDRGGISGAIYAESAVEGIQVWAYDLAADPQPNPGKSKPLYITQASASGRFSLSYMALGQYRIFAVADRDLNRLYDAERELLAVASQDFLLTTSDPLIQGVVLRAAVRDTTPPELAGATAPDRRHVDLRFSERMSETYLGLSSNYLILAENDTLQVLDALLDKRNPAYVHLLTAPQSAGTSYLTQVKQGRDLANFTLIADSAKALFSGAALDDSVKPYLIRSTPEDKSRNIPLSAPITFTFSEALDSFWSEQAFRLQDTSKTMIPGHFTWPDAATMQFQPDSLLKPMQNYLVKLSVDSVRDRNGNKLADTLVTVQFQTLAPDTLSEISGSIRDDASGEGRFYLRLRMANGPVYELWQENEGFYRFPAILPGNYTIDFYRDKDGDNQYSFGTPFPYMPAERYAVYPDTIEVRSRWPNEGNDLVLPK